MSSISLKTDKLFGELSEDYKAILLENDFIYIFLNQFIFLRMVNLSTDKKTILNYLIIHIARKIF